MRNERDEVYESMIGILMLMTNTTKQRKKLETKKQKHIN